MKKYTRIVALGLVFIALFQACKKDNIERTLTKPSRLTTKEDLLKDSVYLYTDFFYLWQDQLPQSFPTRSYKTAEEVLEALKTYSKDPITNAQLDRYSFLDRSGTVNTEIQEGLLGSFGFDVRYQNNTDLYIKLVYPGSPAQKANIERSWQILSINGNTRLDNASLSVNNYKFLWDALDASNIALKLKRPDNVVVDVNLQRAQFNLNPILYNNVFNAGNKKVGYFVLESFVSTEAAGGRPTNTKANLDQIFGHFESEQVDEVIVDLRYNGGGAVITAEYLSNMLAPTSVGNQLMYKYGINETLNSQEDWRLYFSPVNYHKTNTLNLNRIYFIVTEGTASASELLINNLKPYIDIKLIGENKTYGKPVGFFPWTIMKNDLYAVSFKTINAADQSDYYDGMPVDKDSFDDLTKPWGDQTDPMVMQALNYAENGVFLSSINLQSTIRTNMLNRKESNPNQQLDQHGNKDMFYFPNKLPVKIKDSSFNR